MLSKITLDYIKHIQDETNRIKKEIEAIARAMFHIRNGYILSHDYDFENYEFTKFLGEEYEHNGIGNPHWPDPAFPIVSVCFENFYDELLRITFPQIYIGNDYMFMERKRHEQEIEEANKRLEKEKERNVKKKLEEERKLYETLKAKFEKE